MFKIAPVTEFAAVKSVKMHPITIPKEDPVKAITARINVKVKKFSTGGANPYK